MPTDKKNDTTVDNRDLDNIELSSYSNSNTVDLEALEEEYDQYKKEEEIEYISGNYLNSSPTQNINVTSNPKYEEYKKLKHLDQSYNYVSTEYLDTDYLIPAHNENIITFKEYYNHSLKEYFTFNAAKNYALSIFPIIHWLPFYNFNWFISDLIAGITIGCVLVPQSMSYAQIATLDPQYGLYSSFIGAFVYALFATSKDVCIGPVAVMSLETAKVIADVSSHFQNDPDVTGPIIATTLALLCGGIAAAVGFLRLGFLVELISLNAVTGFMTGSAFNILWGQVPGLMGYSKLVNTRQATYKVVIDTLKHLPDTKLDAVFGLIPLFILYVVKWWCTNYGLQLAEKQFSSNERYRFYLKKFYFYTNAMRNAVVIIIFTAISWSITRNKSSSERPITVLGTVPSGLKDIGVFKPQTKIVQKIGPQLPASIIVLLLEHIAIAKSFGRINDYKIVPDQELIAIGISNLVGTFFSAYPATGSFSRSALNAKCNVKTPLSGIFTGGCVLLALYCLTGAFFYIPKATLSAVIIHAVSDLIASYQTTLSFWNMNPLDTLCFLVTVLITVFSSIENGIYFAMCYSCALFIFRSAFPAGKFLGRIEIAEVINATPKDDFQMDNFNGFETSEYNNFPADQSYGKFDIANKNTHKYNSPHCSKNFYTKWVPFDHTYTKELNKDVEILEPPPGVIVYRLSDSFIYLNCSRHFDTIFDEVKRKTKRGKFIGNIKKSQRPWNDPGEWEAPTWMTKKFSIRNLFKRKQEAESNVPNEDASTDLDISNNKDIDMDHRPVLQVICLDFSQVSQTDNTALQSLFDLRKSVNSYADRQVEFHFCGIISPWVKRGLIKLGFGTVNEAYSDASTIVGHVSYHIVKNPTFRNKSFSSHTSEDTISDMNIEAKDYNNYSIEAASGTNYPFFHIDIPNFSKWDV
ncbi:hypothetical protein TPHA_0J00800 [Tetrapisispora phaffii CBS 4417]|uniref:STAS domain-containing protein n=1 Tax=Tetrapisispora phaffii (strain ATCC 24235 / CBS 4417 / NBRC 1672 / NRRL Y-8282 / UCD 70-5) TaxID=1071381 RepID=G8BYG1_TETPH|nr:hypothetical protein TPHA_0J00800 [Tetrapisispora phaffii CBS 4417]CCE64903.1 hypothetical protein TPHA_0J00800 [Tetrapisispora phaffii CBS 4417]